MARMDRSPHRIGALVAGALVASALALTGCLHVRHTHHHFHHGEVAHACGCGHDAPHGKGHGGKERCGKAHGGKEHGAHGGKGHGHRGHGEGGAACHGEGHGARTLPEGHPPVAPQQAPRPGDDEAPAGA